jgi:hypothetical protein
VIEQPIGNLSVPNHVLDQHTISAAPPPTISINDSNGRALVKIQPDGTIEYGDDYNPDDAAQAFWDAIRRWSWSSAAMFLAALHTSEAAASAWGTVWLCGNWRSLTRQMDSEAREIAASGVLRWMHDVDDTDGRPHRLEPDELRWWRE